MYECACSAPNDHDLPSEVGSAGRERVAGVVDDSYAKEIRRVTFREADAYSYQLMLRRSGMPRCPQEAGTRRSRPECRCSKQRRQGKRRKIRMSAVGAGAVERSRTMGSCATEVRTDWTTLTTLRERSAQPGKRYQSEQDRAEAGADSRSTMARKEPDKETYLSIEATEIASMPLPGELVKNDPNCPSLPAAMVTTLPESEILLDTTEAKPSVQPSEPPRDMVRMSMPSLTPRRSASTMTSSEVEPEQPKTR